MIWFSLDWWILGVDGGGLRKRQSQGTEWLDDDDDDDDDDQDVGYSAEKAMKDIFILFIICLKITNEFFFHNILFLLFLLFFLLIAGSETESLESIFEAYHVQNDDLFLV